MRAPVIAPIGTAHPTVQQGLPVLPERQGIELFVVVGEGSFAGQHWGTGEVLVCRGEARSGDPVVLVARGQGRPRLGRVEGARFLGDAGEPCHPARWVAAGRVVAAYRRRAAGWVVDLLPTGAAAEGPGEVPSVATPSAVANEVPPAAAPSQLSLFAA